MESERGASSKTVERPLSRWRRDPENSLSDSYKVDRPSTGIARPQSKYDRPKSRRGIKDEIAEHNSGSYRSATPGRNALARPPSASILSNRAPTAGSRLGTMSSTGLGRLNTGLPMTAQIGANLLERPITQQGIAGVRPGTTRGLPMTRQIQDKRYYIGLLQLKIRELTQEISVIMKDIEMQNKERATFLHYDKRAKDLAAELTTLQGELADYNIVVDKMTSDIDKTAILEEARQLALKNEHTFMEIERMFDQRRELQQQLSKMEKQLENEKRRTERIVESMDPNTKERYEDLCKQKVELQEKANKLQQELDDLFKEQSRLEEEIALSPLKQEAVKLHLKIIEAEEKRDKLREEEKNRLSPEEEKERLLHKIKRDNIDIAAAEAQLGEKKKQITKVEQELEHLEAEMEDTQTEKQVKYKELRKREEVMENFMSSFEQNKEVETNKLAKLEETVVKHLGAISSMVDIDMNFATGEEMTILHSITSHEDYERINHDQTFDGLSKEYIRLQQTLNQLEIMEQKMKTESAELNKKISEREGKLILLEDLDNLKAKSEMKREELTAEYANLKQQQSFSEEELRVIQDEYNDVKLRLKHNDIYSEISELESKLEQMKDNRKKIEDFIAEQRDRANYGPLKERAFNLADEYDAILKECLKPIY